MPLLWMSILFVLTISCNKKVDIAETSTKQLVFKEEQPGVPDAVCVLHGCHLPLSDPRCAGGSVYCCLKSKDCCCKMAVPSPDNEVPNSIYDDPITFVDIDGLDTIYTTGAVESLSISIIGSDTIYSIDSLRVDSTWIVN